MSQSEFHARLSRLDAATTTPGQFNGPENGDKDIASRELKPWSLPTFVFKVVLCWGGFFLVFGFVYFLGALGVSSRPTQWMLELGLGGIAGVTGVLSVLCMVVGFMESRGMIVRPEKK